SLRFVRQPQRGEAVSDRRILYAAAFLRAVASGMVGVLIAIDLVTRGFSPGEAGAVVSAGLTGAALAALLVTVEGDRLGRRRTQIALALIGALGAVGVAMLRDHAAVLGAAFVGMLNGMGKDRGAALVLDQAVLPATTDDRDRTRTFAWYSVLQDAGHA